MEFEGFYGVGWRSPVSVRATATLGLERFHRKIATMGEGMGELSLANRATIANMSPEYGATMGFFPVDHVTLQYLKLTGRSNETVEKAVDSLYSEFRLVDNLVARNIARVLKAFQNARVGSHVSARQQVNRKDIGSYWSNASPSFAVE